MTKILPSDKHSLTQAVRALQSGGLVAVPTETVYGLCADANNLDAVEKIYAIKHRPKTQAISVLIPNLDALDQWAINIPQAAYQLGREFWPGPMTLILEKKPSVSSRLTAGKPSIGLRIPNHAFTLKLLSELNTGLAAPSANLSGQTPATTASEVLEIFGDQVDLIIDGGTCDIGIASTIIDLTQSPFKILREGAISLDQIQAVSCSRS